MPTRYGRNSQTGWSLLVSHSEKQHHHKRPLWRKCTRGETSRQNKTGKPDIGEIMLF